MNVIFIQDNPLDESQSLIDLSGFLKSKGHSCTLFLSRMEPNILSSVRSAKPDIVVVACSMLNHGWARNIAQEISRNIEVPTILGGTGPTLYPEMLNGQGVDFIIRGEAERPILEIIDALELGAKSGELDNIPGMYRWEGTQWVGTPAGPPMDIDEIPVASKDIYYDRYPFMRQFPFKRFLSSRGCHHRCTYCYISALNKVQPRGGGKRVRRKSPEQAVEEVAREAAKGPLEHVHFSDDLFTNDGKWLQSFAQHYRRRVGIPFTCNTSAELIDDDAAQALAEAGCFATGFAVETASRDLRLKVLRKGVTTEHLHKAAAHLKRHGVSLATFNMIALPGETPNEALQTARLNTELETRFVRLNYAFPMPGTGMCDYAIENGFLDPDWPSRFGDPEFKYQPGPQFKTPYAQEFKNLFVLFRLASTNGTAASMVDRMLRTRTPKLVHKLMTLQGAWNEKQNFRIPISAGFKFFAKVGRPEMRATNFPALI